jgi:hypothetical protein
MSKVGETPISHREKKSNKYHGKPIKNIHQNTWLEYRLKLDGSIGGGSEPD